ncbi:hypothetical protein [Dactylosporangium sp. CA-139066]|uniref:hypothetical protein n=1 Tax=Dactylosporangium sp. CA-139066 TaxID=3239930 RepID=UPI003D8F0F09
MADNDPAAGPSEVRLDAVQSLDAFARACDRLRAGRSYAALGKAARPRPLPPATLSDLLNAKSTPTRDTVITFLLACGLGEAAQRPWLATWERVATAHQPRPAGAVRVQEARPRLLGVHTAIQIPGTTEELPPYVPRDLDADLRAALTAAAVEGGFVLLVGGSSVGKTRALYEAVRAGLREWWLLHPADAPAITAHAENPTPRTVVVWLDELQRYLNHPTGLLAGTLRQLITAGTVIVATIWPDEYNIRTARPPGGQPDPYANDRELLGFARLIEVPETFSRAERRRGEALAGIDQRIRIALDTTDAGFSQVLAAGPALIHRWEQAPPTDCYGKAVITAALDAHRVGAHQPATSDFLNDAAPAYLTPVQQAIAPPDWLDRALAYATTEVRGAAACLAPVPAGMGRTAGYITADYLRQHAHRTRRTTVLPEPVWQALIAHHHPDDTARLFQNARRRGQPNHAVALYLRADATPRDPSLHARVADLLAEQGRVDELRDLTATGNSYAAFQLADLLAEQDRIDEALQVLRDLAATGHPYAADRLADLLARQDRVDELRDLTATGNPYAAYQLADLLATQDRVDELRDLTATGNQSAAYHLANRLAEQGHIDEALQELRDLAVTGNQHAANRLADLLAEQDRVDELRDLTAAGHPYVADRLVDLLAEQDRVDELRDLAATGNQRAARRLAGLLAEHGRVDELRDLTATGNQHAAERLADLLAEQDRVDELRDLAATGNPYVADRLADLLAEQDRIDEALQVLRDLAATGDPYGAHRLVNLLAEQGRIDELRDLAATGDLYVADRLADLLAEQDRIDELRDLAATGDPYVADRLADLLAKQDRIDELRDLAATGDPYVANRLADLLAKQDRIDEALQVLRDLAATGNPYATHWLVDLLAEQDRIDELRDLAATGDPYVPDRLVGLLAEQGRIDELRDEVAAGTPSAVEGLRRLEQAG